MEIFIEKALDKVDGIIDTENLGEEPDGKLREASKKVAEDSPELASNITGRKVQKIDESQKNRIEEEVYQELTKLRQIDRVKENKEEKKEAIRNEVLTKANKVFSSSFNREIEDELDLSWMTEEVDDRVNTGIDVLSDTLIEEYRDCIEQFISELKEENMIEGAYRYIHTDVPGTDEKIIREDTLDVLLDEQTEYFEEKNLPEKRRDMKEVLNHYKQTIDIVEKFLPQLICSYEFYKGKSPEYSKYRSMRLGNALEKLESYDILGELSEGLDVDKRNSISHGDRLIEPFEKKVKFTDEGEIIDTLTFEEIIEESKEALALLIALWEFQALVMKNELPKSLEEN